MLEEHEDYQHQHQTRSRQRLEQRRQLPEDGRRLYGHEHRLFRVRRKRAVLPTRVGLLQFVEELLDCALELLDDAALAGSPQIGNLVFEVARVLGQLIRERCELARHRPANATEDDKRQHHDQDHRRRASEPEALEHADDRIQQEGQQDGQRHRDQHHASPRQTRNDQDETRKGIKQWRLADHSGHDDFLYLLSSPIFATRWVSARCRAGRD